MTPKIVIWDWNGTVLDDLDVSLDAVNDMLERRGIKTIDKETYYEYLDTPIIKFYQRALGREDVPFDEISREFNDYYRKNIHRTALTKGVREVIEELKHRGIPQMIISASHISYIEAQVKELGLEGCFEKIIAAEDYVAGSKVERAVKYMDGVKAYRTGRLVVGDTLHDYEMAKSLDARCILLTSGHEGEKKLKRTDALVVDTLTIDHILSLKETK